MFSIWLAVLMQDMRLYWRKGGDVVMVLSFFLIALVLFPFALGADNPNVASYAPAFIWIVALLASLLSLSSMFQKDYEDGTLDQIRRSQLAIEWCVLAKILANWLACHIPLVIFSPLAGLMLGMDVAQIPRVLLTLLISTPVLSAVGAVGSALMLEAGNKTGLLALLVLPLYVPVLIFAAITALSAPDMPVLSLPEMQVSLAFLFGMVPLSCIASAAVIRLQG